MSKKSFNNVEPDISQQNIIVKKRRKTKQKDLKPTGTEIFNLHPFVKKSKGYVTKLYSKKSFLKQGNSLSLACIY